MAAAEAPLGGRRSWGSLRRRPTPARRFGAAGALPEPAPGSRGSQVTDESRHLLGALWRAGSIGRRQEVDRGWANWANHGQSLPPRFAKFARRWPNLVNNGNVYIGIGQVSVQLWSKLPHIGLNWARIFAPGVRTEDPTEGRAEICARTEFRDKADSAQTAQTSAKVGPKSAKRRPSSTKIARTRGISAETRPNLGDGEQLWPESGRVWPSPNLAGFGVGRQRGHLARKHSQVDESKLGRIRLMQCCNGFGRVWAEVDQSWTDVEQSRAESQCGDWFDPIRARKVGGMLAPQARKL